MRSIMLRIAGILVPLALVGCDGFFGFRGADDATGADAVGPDAPSHTTGVAVIAEVRSDDNVISYTVANHGADTVYHALAFLERREGSGWRDVYAGEPRALVLYVRPIASGEDYSVERPIEAQEETLSPGEYRFNVSLYGDGKLERLLPEDVRTSNIIRIE